MGFIHKLGASLVNSIINIKINDGVCPYNINDKMHRQFFIKKINPVGVGSSV
ncbi:MAG: hypothetical protein F6K22_13960 [Okeania sp. SIO2F4]|uniref:hypothetical protein n=1 Tax=Okeania sp. SIO2F4 TaxID=2607790 RepID=UPI001429BCAC|nr:hypothetical protein [Okeania sp. SIO2F4]NES03846.1 hypothetical protein [Okeania sp. SIO2F4]